MSITKTEFKGLYIFEPKVYKDERGYFFESYNQQLWNEAGIKCTFVQDNESKSQYGTLRGLHYQLPPHDQAKLVRVTQGKVLDIVVDIRPEQPTYGQSYSIELSSRNKKQMLIPKGFAHGFVTLSKTAVFNYKCSNLYNKESEGQINPLDKSLKLDWGILKKDMILSKKDKAAPAFGKHKKWPKK